jgi:hypothetical protein
MEGCPPLEFPIQQFSYTARKNATDSALIIDAMDLLRRREPGRLLPGLKRQRLHPPRLTDPESGLIVYWFREEKTPKAFVDACDKFIYTGILPPADSAGAATPVSRDDSLFRDVKKRPEVPETAEDQCRGLVRRTGLGRARAGRAEHPEEEPGI